MKIEEVKAMLDMELRVKVAQLCGWVSEIDSRDLTCVCVSWTKDGKVVPSNGHLPDYPRDLNAMYELEKIIPKSRRDEYAMWLWDEDLVENDRRHESAGWNMAHSSARKRAMAFVMTMEGET